MDRHLKGSEDGAVGLFQGKFFQIQLRRFLEIFHCFLDALTLADGPDFRTLGYVKIILFMDDSGKGICHLCHLNIFIIRQLTANL